jgi:hypothetical protein
MKLRVVVSFISLLISGPVLAGWFEDTVTNAAKRVTERGVDEAADGVYESGKEAVTQEPEAQKPEKQQKKSSRKAEPKPKKAEKEVVFSGKWLFNQARSKAAEGTSFSGSKVTLVILHEGDSIDIIKTITTPGGMVDTTSESYALDGEEHVSDEGSAVTKRIGNWSDDRKQVVLKQTVTVGAKELVAEEVYSLSNGGKVLTVRSTESMNGEGTSIRVYEKQ